MGDRGDGTPEGRAAAKLRTAHLNAGHAPDLFRLGPTHLYELRCYAFACASHDAHGGSRTQGGSPASVDGGFIAFGNTLEGITCDVFGLSERGSRADGPFCRHTRTSSSSSSGCVEDAAEGGRIAPSSSESSSESGAGARAPMPRARRRRVVAGIFFLLHGRAIRTHGQRASDTQMIGNS